MDLLFTAASGLVIESTAGEGAMTRLAMLMRFRVPDREGEISGVGVRRSVEVSPLWM
jgi:hypothetical protein